MPFDFWVQVYQNNNADANGKIDFAICIGMTETS